MCLIQGKIPYLYIYITTPLHRFFLQQSRLLHRLLQVIGSSLITPPPTSWVGHTIGSGDLERKGFMSQLFTTTPLHRFFLQQSRLLHRLLQVIGSSLITRTSHYLQRSSCWWRINQTFSGTFARFSVLERARTVGNKLASVKILVLLSAEIFLR